jgi:hypothetical protein
VDEKQQEEKIAAIWETEEDKLLSINKLKEKYVHYAHSHLIKTPHLVVINQNTQWEIQITGQDIKEWRQKSRTRPRIIAIQLLDQMIKTAKLISTEKDRYNTPGIEAVSEFENRCMIEDQLFKIRITVKEQVNRRFAYYFGAIKMD